MWQCTSTCGWVAALVSAISFGSFGVPVKSGKSNKVNVDPLVMQTYKTFMIFATCWLVVLAGEEVRVTPWGILSGLFWVPGGTCGIYGIRNAGLAIAVGTWSSLIVISSFCWGLLVFQEEVRSIPGAIVACLLLVAGLLGMARYSNPGLQNKTSAPPPIKQFPEDRRNNESSREDSVAKRRRSGSDGIDDKATVLDGVSSLEIETLKTVGETGVRHDPSVKHSKEATADADDGSRQAVHLRPPTMDVPLILFNGQLVLSRRQMGMLGAVINGLWGGTNMIPLHYASKEGYGGPKYIVSFGCGSALVNILMWILRYMYFVHVTNYNFREAYNSLPSFHIRDMWAMGMMAGALNSLGHFSSIIAVTHLGQGVGYSVGQSAMLVSGLWGIFYFGEIRGAEIISKWLLAAVTTIAGILLLSHEHVDRAGGGH